jgi:hypothetical protein
MSLQRFQGDNTGYGSRVSQFTDGGTGNVEWLAQGRVPVGLSSRYADFDHPSCP